MTSAKMFRVVKDKDLRSIKLVVMVDFVKTELWLLPGLVTSCHRPLIAEKFLEKFMQN